MIKEFNTLTGADKKYNSDQDEKNFYNVLENFEKKMSNEFGVDADIDAVEA